MVVSVTDRDTIKVNHAGGLNDPLRLTDINTPESGECYGPESTLAPDYLLASENVILIRDISDRDSVSDVCSDTSLCTTAFS